MFTPTLILAIDSAFALITRAISAAERALTAVRQSAPLPNAVEIIHRPVVDPVPLRRILQVKTLAEAQRIAREALGLPAEAPAFRPVIKAEQFARELRGAILAANSAHPERWHLAPGASHWVEIPAGLRSYRTDLGTLIKLPDTYRIPAAEFWTEGRLPVGIVVPGKPASTPTMAPAPEPLPAPTAPKPAKPRGRPRKAAAPLPIAA